MTVLDATQVGVGAGPINIAAAIVLVGGIVLAALWVRSLTT
jgi:lysine/ornithine N-monooxygenase